MESVKTTKNSAKIKIAIAVPVILLILGVIVFFNTSFGKLQTLKHRGYTEISANVYLDQDCDPATREEILQLLTDSRLRVEAFWGEIESTPVIVFSNSQERLAGLGLTVNSAAVSNYVMNGAITFIGIYIPKVETDILAHEMNHAEFYERVYKGRFSTSPLVPMWFDEGLAMQVDDREKYGEEAWLAMTEAGTSPRELTDIETGAQFFAGDSDTRTNNYITSRHEVKTWYEENGHERLLELIKGVNEGTGFHELYN